MKFNRESMIEFFKKNMSICIWCDYDCDDSYKVNVSLSLDGEEICSSSDYLPSR